MIAARGPASKLLALLCLAMLSARSSAADDSQLPSYKPQRAVSGTIRSFGSNLGGVLKLWEERFRKFHPDVRFEDKLPTSDAAISALVTGVADLGPDGSEATLTENLSFFEVLPAALVREELKKLDDVFVQERRG